MTPEAMWNVLPGDDLYWEDPIRKESRWINVERFEFCVDRSIILVTSEGDTIHCLPSELHYRQP